MKIPKKALATILTLLLLLGVSLSGGLGLAQAASTLPAFAFLDSSETVDQMMERINAATPAWREGYLTNGKPITMENIEEMVDGILRDMPAGSTWDTSARYYYTLESAKKFGNGYTTFGGCDAFAYSVSDYIFGEDAPVTKHQNFNDVKPGDVVSLRNYSHTGNPSSASEYGHVVFVIGQGERSGFPDEDGFYMIFDGNVGGTISAPHPSQLGHENGSDWPPEMFANTWVYTRYGDEISGQPAGTPTQPKPTFPDVPATHWSFAFVEKAASEGWVKGVGNGLFAPNQEISYAELAALLCRAKYPSELERYEARTATGDPWYQGAVQLADVKGLWAGTAMEDGSGKATATINRYEMAQVLYNLMERHGNLPDSTAAQTAKGQIADWTGIPGNYQQAVASCYAARLLSGTDQAGSYTGTMSMTRCQAAKIMCTVDEVVTGSWTAPVVTPQKPAESGSTAQQVMDSINADTPAYREGFLTDGTETWLSDVTLRDFADRFCALLRKNTTDLSGQVYANSFDSGKDDKAFALALSDYVYGEDAPVVTFSSLKYLVAGDLIQLTDGRWGMVLSAGMGDLDVLVGNMNGNSETVYVSDWGELVNASMIGRRTAN